jgi:hypothetical protein
MGGRIILTAVADAFSGRPQHGAQITSGRLGCAIPARPDSAWRVLEIGRGHDRTGCIDCITQLDAWPRSAVGHQENIFPRAFLVRFFQEKADAGPTSPACRLGAMSRPNRASSTRSPWEAWRRRLDRGRQERHHIGAGVTVRHHRRHGRGCWVLAEPTIGRCCALCSTRPTKSSFEQTKRAQLSE